MTNKIVAGAFATLMLMAPAYATIALQPGEWQTTETGLEDGKPVAPQVEKECMTPEEARDATSVVKQMKDEMMKEAAGAGQCPVADIKESGNTVTMALKCGDPKMMAFDISATFTFVSATRYTGAMKSAVSIGGRSMTTDKKIDAVRVGECKPGQAKKR